MEGIVSYVLSGGIGARLAPCSTPAVPKQFLRMFGGDTLLGATIERMAAGGVPVNLVGSRADLSHLDVYRGRVAAFGGTMLLEPARRNTAMAVAVATAHVLESGTDGLVLITPADHQVESAAAFSNAVAAGLDAARDGRLVLIGIRPTRPETGFGYIEIADAMEGARVVDVRRFSEKPDMADAIRYCASGRHFWNSGVFLFSPAVVGDWFKQWAPDTWRAADHALSEAGRQPGRIDLAERAYETAPASPFDRAIVERAPRVSMVRADFRWRDLGTWRSLVEATVAPWQPAQ